MTKLLNQMAMSRLIAARKRREAPPGRDFSGKYRINDFTINQVFNSAAPYYSARKRHGALRIDEQTVGIIMEAEGSFSVGQDEFAFRLDATFLFPYSAALAATLSDDFHWNSHPAVANRLKEFQSLLIGFLSNVEPESSGDIYDHAFMDYLKSI